MVGGTATERVEIPREQWAATLQRMRDPARSRGGVVISGLEPCERCGVAVVTRQDLADGSRAVVEVLALAWQTDPGGARGMAGWTSPHRCRGIGERPATGPCPARRAR